MTKIISPLLALAVLFPAAGQSASSVRIWEDSVTVPTYQSGPPDATPLFYDGRGYQGAKGPIYPYPIIDRLTGVKADRAYKEICLENEYIKICVLPELGGRIFTGVDKTNGYPFFYQQHVIKPALIGMTGAWISGGVEWDIPHHHRASSFMPVNYQMQENADGSKTVLVGEMELRHRMRWTMALTLHPGKSYIDACMKLRNLTAVSNSFLYFANVAVHADKDYQIIFPPSTQFATQHSKVEFSRWPIGGGPYGAVEFPQGTDVSWYKNHPAAASMFAFDCKEDFLAGYDHGRAAGTLHIADHGVSPGKKFFTWGVGHDGQVWDRLLTDNDGPYLELMVGGFSDNQPDYSWIQPYETKIVHEYWYPFRQIGGVKNANLEAAVNLEMAGASRARLGFAATSEQASAKAVLRAGDKVLFEQNIALGPGKPFVTEVAIPAETTPAELRASLEADGRTLISYQPKEPPKSPLPAPVTPPPPPSQIQSNDELYLAGMRLQQFHSPAAEPEPYFEEAIRRDPGDYRANTALGILYYRRGLFRQAEERLAAAVARAAHNYTSPRDGEACYYLGLTQKALGQFQEAHESLYKASWSWAWRAPAYYALAELASRGGERAQALAFLDDSLAANTLNTKALNLKAALLRKSGRENEAAAAASAALAIDPLDQRSRREARLARGEDPPRATIQGVVNDDVQPYLEMAADYAGAGLWDEGTAALKELESGYADKQRVHAMAYYWLGWLEERQGNASEAARYYRLAARMPTDYVFPFRVESIEVLRRAAEADPSDARAPYYLGNLLYDLQPEDAIRAWEKAAALDGNFALVQRNLAFAYARVQHQYGKAQEVMAKAVALQADPRFVVEYDEICEGAGVPAPERLAAFEKHPDAYRERDDAMGRFVALNVIAGRYDKALELLGSRHFNVWEGGENALHDSWVDAHLLRGDSRFRAGRYQEALKDYQAALEYPENLAVGRPLDGGRSAAAYFAIAETQKRLGNAAAAKSALLEAVAETGARRSRRRGWSEESAETSWYKARAFEALGNRTEAAEIYEMLVRNGESSLKGRAVNYFAKFGSQAASSARQAHGHYLLALGYLGQGKAAEGKSELEAVLKYDANHLGAKRQLAALGNAQMAAPRSGG
jgi:tetratricopeptide (TPR) repeat protein